MGFLAIFGVWLIGARATYLAMAYNDRIRRWFGAQLMDNTPVRLDLSGLLDSLFWFIAVPIRMFFSSIETIENLFILLIKSK